MLAVPSNTHKETAPRNFESSWLQFGVKVIVKVLDAGRGPIRVETGWGLVVVDVAADTEGTEVAAEVEAAEDTLV